MGNLKTIREVTKHLSANLMGTEFHFKIAYDDKYGKRIYVQCVYDAPCTKTGEVEEWKGRKWYLSDHMTNDEIVKTCYSAFKSAVEHELMEGFKVGGVILF